MTGSKKLSLSLGMVYVKKHYDEERILVAACDAELLDKTIIDEEKGIRFHVNNFFYGGDLVSVERALEELRKADIANIVGKRIVDAAVRNGLIHRDAVIMIKDIPHAQFVTLGEEE
jgi:hypothetical protein